MQKLLRKLKGAIWDYNMIQSGDKIAVGLSGGKDSITLLNLLNAYKRFSKQKFNLIAITLDIGTCSDIQILKKHCENLNIELHVIKTDIKEIVFDIKKDKNPCSLCANLRRGALNRNAKLLKCNKVALGHHKNDAIETLLMSILYEGRIHCFSPKTYLSNIDITVIRPMVYIGEDEIINTVKENNLPVIKNCCPANGFTKRQYIKDLIHNVKKDIPFAENNILSSIKNTKQLNIWNKEI